MKPNYKILIIDDNIIDQIVTKQLLKKVLGLTEISTANNGKEGIQWLNNHKKNVEELIILLDIKMPEMDGDRKSTRLNSSHGKLSRMPSSA